MKDDIPDAYVVLDETPVRHLNFEPTGRGLWQHNFSYFATIDKPPIYSHRLQADPIDYRDSFVNETYLEGRFVPGSGLKVVQKARLRLNWQQGGQLRPGLTQRERRLDLWTWVSRVEYTCQWRSPNATVQVHVLPAAGSESGPSRRRHLQESGPALRDPIDPDSASEYPLLSRPVLRVGFQGLGPLPYRVNDRVRDIDSFEHRTAFASLTNHSRYFGYDLLTIVGLNKDRRVHDDPLQRTRNFEVWSVFVRAVIGFTEYGPPI